MTKLEKQLTYDGRPENGGKITVEDLNRCQADNASPLRIVIPHYNGEPYAGLVANTFELCAAVRCVEAGKTFFIRQDEPPERVCSSCNMRRYCRHLSPPEIVDTNFLHLGYAHTTPARQS